MFLSQVLAYYRARKQKDARDDKIYFSIKYGRRCEKAL
jgi:hypothetical protein